MVKEYNITAIVVFVTLIEGLAIYINLIAHPASQPHLTVVIVVLSTFASGLGMWWATNIRGWKFK